MIPIKIQCECGQRYAFDVEPTNGRMPSLISCPTCGADGTTAANMVLAQKLAPVVVIDAPRPRIVRLDTPQPPVTPLSEAVHSIQSSHATTGPPIQMASVATAPTPTSTRRPDPRLGQVDRKQAEHEARAKAMWGDSQEQITGYLLGQGFSYQEALETVQTLVKERASAVRANGIRKIIIGCGFMCIPVVTTVIFIMIGFFLVKVMAAAVMAGLYGLWLFINGILMAVAPKSERGDVADQ